MRLHGGSPSLRLSCRISFNSSSGWYPYRAGSPAGRKRARMFCSIGDNSGGRIGGCPSRLEKAQDSPQVFHAVSTLAHSSIHRLAIADFERWGRPPCLAHISTPPTSTAKGLRKIEEEGSSGSTQDRRPLFPSERGNLRIGVLCGWMGKRAGEKRRRSEAGDSEQGARFESRNFRFAVVPASPKPTGFFRGLTARFDEF